MYEKIKGPIAEGDKVGWWRQIAYNDIATTDQWHTGTIVDVGAEWVTVESSGERYRVRIRQLRVVDVATISARRE